MQRYAAVVVNDSIDHVMFHCHYTFLFDDIDVLVLLNDLVVGLETAFGRCFAFGVLTAMAHPFLPLFRCFDLLHVTAVFVDSKEDFEHV